MIVDAENKSISLDNNEENPSFFIEVSRREMSVNNHNPISHYHQSIELIYCISGKMKISFVSREVILNENDLIFINSNYPHSINSYLSNSECYHIKFDPSVIELKMNRPLPHSSYFFFLLDEFIVYKDFEDTEYIQSLCKRCYDNFTNEIFSKRLILQASVLELCAYIFEKNSDKIQDLNFEDKDSVFLDTVKYINKNYASATLEKAAKNASMSYSYFSRLFKKEFNTNFNKYLNSVRIQKSIEYLSNSSMNISQIALQCGFSNLSHFTKCFKEETGITPNKYRSFVQDAK